jgi:hypothetical protein
MAKVLKFNARKSGKIGELRQTRGLRGQVIEFRGQESINNSKKAEIRKQEEDVAQALFLWCF